MSASQLQASFTDTKTNFNTSQTGTVSLAFGDTTGPYTVTVNDLLPGQSQSVYFNVKNVGSITFGSLQAKMKTSGELVDRPAPTRTYQTVENGKVITKTGNGGNPAVVQIQSCSSPWVNGVCSTGASNSYGPVAGNVDSGIMTIAHGKNLKPGQTAYLKATYTLNAAAGPEYEGKTASFSYTMTATQRDGHTTNGQEAF